MKPVEFAQQTMVLAKDQPQYEPFPVHYDANLGACIGCFELTEEERSTLAAGGRLWLWQYTFGRPFQPVQITTEHPWGEPGLPVGVMGKVTLTAAEITDLAEFAGLTVTCPDDIEPDTEIDVYPCPADGVRNEGEPDDPDTVSHYRFVAVMTEYPEEGCVGLGDEIDAPERQESTR